MRVKLTHISGIVAAAGMAFVTVLCTPTAGADDGRQQTCSAGGGAVQCVTNGSSQIYARPVGNQQQAAPLDPSVQGEQDLFVAQQAYGPFFNQNRGLGGAALQNSGRTVRRNSR